MPKKYTRYTDLIRLDDLDIVRVNVHPQDRPELLTFLQASQLRFQCGRGVSGEEQLTFAAGTTVDQVHIALDEFDRLSRGCQS